MKITIATGPMLPVPALLGGAIPKMWHALARAFARRGHEVCIFARSYPGQPEAETLEGVRFLRAGGFSQSRSVAANLARDLAYAIAHAGRLPQADILVINDFWLPVIARGRQATVGRIVINANRFPKGQFWLYDGVASIVAASGAVRDEIARAAPALAARLSVVPNPVDREVMRPRVGEPTGEVRTLLYAGRVHPEKGVHLLAEAFARLAERHPGWRLRIVGPLREPEGGGGERYVAGLRERLGGAPAEISGPEFDARALAELYRGADLFCYPSLADRGESFGLAALEAMACGVPPVVSGLACFRDFVLDGDNGWVFEHRGTDPAGALRARLEAAMGDASARAEAGRRAARTAGRFGVEEVAAQYLELFAGLAGAR